MRSFGLDLMYILLSTPRKGVFLLATSSRARNRRGIDLCRQPLLRVALPAWLLPAYTRHGTELTLTKDRQQCPSQSSTHLFVIP